MAGDDSLTWVVLMAAVVSVAAWAAHLLGEEDSWFSSYWAGGVTVAMAVALALFWGWRQEKKRRQATQLQQDLSDKPPVTSEAAKLLQESMDAAVRKLQRTKLPGRQGLYSLPWLAVVGASASGKSSLLDVSGLQLEPVQGSPGAGPSAVSWGYSDRAVVLDVAGRLISESSAQPEWITFLKTLRRLRSRRPLDAVVLVVEASEFQGDVAKRAQVLRGKLADLVEHSDRLPPVYLLVSKLDRLDGFDKFWQDLHLKHQGRMWGATIDGTVGLGAKPEATIKAEFDELGAALRARAMFRLNSQDNLETRASLLNFPVQFEQLRTGLMGFVQELSRPGRRMELPPIQGFYFCAAPSGPLTVHSSHNSAQAAGYGLETQVMSTAPTQGFFLRAVFEKLVLSGHFPVQPSRRRVRRHRLFTRLAALALAFSSVGGVVPAIVSYFENERLLSGVSDTLRVARQEAATGANERAVQRLSQLGDWRRELQETSGIAHWWGGYTAPKLLPLVDSEFNKALEQLATGRVQEHFRGSLRTVRGTLGASGDSFENDYEQLKLYLMLARPHRLDIQWARKPFAREWNATISTQEFSNGELSAASTDYLLAVKEGRLRPWQENSDLVAEVRERLESQRLQELEFEKFVKPADVVPKVGPANLFVNNVVPFLFARSKTKSEVRGRFTALGWQKLCARLLLPWESDYEPWVLGLAEGGVRPWSKTRIEALYRDRFEREWAELFLSLKVRKFHSLKETPDALREASDVLGKAAKRSGAYRRLFSAFSDNFNLKCLPVEVPSPAPGPMSPKGVPKFQLPGKRLEDLLRFSGADAPQSGLNQYLDILRELETTLRLLDDERLSSEEAKKKIAEAGVGVDTLLSRLRSNERLYVETLLLDPIRQTQRLINDDGDDRLNRLWREELYSTYREIKSRFPFSKEGGDSVSLQEFEEFFEPNEGIFNVLTRDSLNIRTERGLKRGGFNQSFVRCWQQAQAITSVFFPRGSTKVNFVFEVSLANREPSVEQTTFRVGGHPVVYDNGKEKWATVSWPGAQPQSGAVLSIRGRNMRHRMEREGEFGLFRMIQEATLAPVQKTGRRSIKLSWTLGGLEVPIRIRRPRGKHPLSSDFFSNFDCPQTIK